MHIGINLIHDFTVVILSVKLGVIREKLFFHDNRDDFR